MLEHVNLCTLNLSNHVSAPFLRQFGLVFCPTFQSINSIKFNRLSCVTALKSLIPPDHFPFRFYLPPKHCRPTRSDRPPGTRCPRTPPRTSGSTGSCTGTRLAKIPPTASAASTWSAWRRPTGRQGCFSPPPPHPRRGESLLWSVESSCLTRAGN